MIGKTEWKPSFGLFKFSRRVIANGELKFGGAIEWLEYILVEQAIQDIV